MSELFVEPEVKDIEEIKVPEVVEAPPKRVKKQNKQHISDERKAELKLIRIEALKKGREAKKAKREAMAKEKAELNETKKEIEKPLLPIEEVIEEKPVKVKVEKKPRAYKSVNNTEVELLKKEKRIKELEYENETNIIKQELVSWQNENRILKQQLDKYTKEKEEEEMKVVKRNEMKNVINKVVVEEPKKEKKKFVTRRVFGF